jgi:3-oxoacyl-[acyl-carrier protein] reductase
MGLASVAGRRVLLTGASSGIGRELAKELAGRGASLALAARRRPLLESLAAEIRSSGSRPPVLIDADLARPGTAREVAEASREAFGGIDVLVNNGGGPSRGSAREVDAEALESAVELLLLSAVRLTNLCLPHLERSRHGRVVNITSSSVREPIERLALSNAVRPGVIGWAKTLAGEVAPQGITVNSIAPGRIDTERLREVYPDGPTEQDLAAIPLRRLGTPREIGDVVCFLASDRAAYVTGTLIAVDGGLTRGLL